jgi:hypothetical protein
MKKDDSVFDFAPEAELGFAPPPEHPLGEERGPMAIAALLASVVLMVATLLIMTAAFGVQQTGRADLPLLQSTQYGPVGQNGG